jgi:23S rRNA (cytidine1920-2'-O)/16S rRNA (cytidine1409-2'-O)-methyltransferase
MNETSSYVSRGGLKLAAALDAFEVDVDGAVCVDLGSNVGGFTDCLLQRGAAGVYAIDTGYGELAWKLRQDDRVSVMERTNAMHVEPNVRGVDLAVIDLGWTPQRHAIPAALRWQPRQIITLIKPHYEASDESIARGRHTGILEESQAERIMQRTLEQMPALGVRVLGHIRSPILGGAKRGRRGNIEYLVLMQPTS